MRAVLAALALAAAVAFAQGGLALPAMLASELPALRLVGEGRLRWFGLHVYDSALWVAGESWSMDRPFALDIRYAMNIKGRDLTEKSLEEMRRLGYSDAQKLRRWEAAMDRVIPDIRPGDRLVGVILLAVRILDAVQDPLFGWWSDRRRSRGGTRWAFVAAGVPLLALGMVGLFNPPAAGTAVLQGWLIVNLVVVYTAFSLVTVSHQAHGAEISDDIAGRTRVTAWREGFALVGVFVASALPEVLKQSVGERAGFAQFSLIFVPLAFILAAVTLWGSPPAHGRRPPAGSAPFK